MIIKDLNINKLIFTKEELDVIEALLQKGLHRNIMSALVSIDPEKEAELQRIINILEPINEGFESEVRKLMNKKLPNGPQSPEEEAEWDAKLQAEYKEWVNAQEKNRAEIEDTLNKKSADDKSIIKEEKTSPESSNEPKNDVKNKLKAAIKRYKEIKDDKSKKEEIKSIKEEIKTLKTELDSQK